jgi:formylglycine-generating enzyme required for sulfatase activity
MLGNVWEWTSSEDGVNRVGRGGSWSYGPRNALVAFRNRRAPGVRYDDLGFRLARG